MEYMDEVIDAFDKYSPNLYSHAAKVNRFSVWPSFFALFLEISSRSHDARACFRLRLCVSANLGLKTRSKVTSASAKMRYLVASPLTRRNTALETHGLSRPRYK